MDLWLSLVEQKVGCSVLIQCICICISFLCSFVSRYLFPFFLLFSEWFKPCVCISTMRALSCVNSIYVYITLRALLYTRVYTSRCVTQQNATNKLKKIKKKKKKKNDKSQYSLVVCRCLSTCPRPRVSMSCVARARARVRECVPHELYMMFVSLFLCFVCFNAR